VDTIDAHGGDGAHRRGPVLDAMLERALKRYDAGKRHGAVWELRTRSELLRVCAKHGWPQAATLLFEEMQRNGEDPGPRASAALMEAYYRAGEIDEETMVTWRRGQRPGGHGGRARAAGRGGEQDEDTFF